jgi:hypothetical protein
MSDFENTNIFSLLSSERSRKLLTIVIENLNLTSIEIHNIYVNKYEHTNRETTYRELEKLQNGGILIKKYDQIKKKIYYENNLDILKLDIYENRLKFVVNLLSHPLSKDQHNY